MRKKLVGLLVSLLAAGSLSRAIGAEERNLVSVIKSPSATNGADEKLTKPALAPSSTTTEPDKKKLNTVPAVPAAECPPADNAETTSPTVSPAGTGSVKPEQPAPKPPTAGQILSQAYTNWKANASEANRAALLSAFKAFMLSSGNQSAPVSGITKGNPVLQQMGVRVIDAGPGRLWAFVRNPEFHQAFVQWSDAKPVVTYVGRRKRIKKITYVTTWKSQELTVPATVTLKGAHVVASAEGTRSLILVGDEKNSTLWLHEYKISDNGWTETPGQFGAVPSFLTTNVSGRVGFRGPDLIFTVARVLPGKAEGISGNVAESDSSTYKFWLRQTDAGYVLDVHLPDEDQFGTVRQFLDNIAENHNDAAKAMLIDSRCLSVPKYIGVQGPSSNFKVIEMASPPNGGARFRLVTGLQDDLIFDVATIKGKPMIKAIFIAPPDGLLQDIAAHLLPYDRAAPPKPPQPTAHAAGGKGA